MLTASQIAGRHEDTKVDVRVVLSALWISAGRRESLA